MICPSQIKLFYNLLTIELIGINSYKHPGGSISYQSGPISVTSFHDPIVKSNVAIYSSIKKQ
jgi:hypothetical protein